MGNPLSCIIVDDEPLSRDILEKYIAETPPLMLAGSCPDAYEAMDLIRNASIDLVFLDINMPRLSGISMVKALEHPPLVIFTTAYPEFAVQGFELDALDYLVKPFGYERFLKAVNKALDRLSVRQNTKEVGPTFIVVKSDKRIFKVAHDSIRYIQSVGDYIKIVTDHQLIVTHDTMKNMVKVLPAEMFIRIHKSFLINLRHVIYLEGNEVNMGREKLPVGASYKAGILKRLSDATPLRG